ncbi:MAG TPA: YciI family protein [Opitutaceae bacterium]|nr:YciI family protein [Opitutaceae bacterium]
MSSPTSSAAQKSYLLLFRNTGPENYTSVTDENRSEVIGRWNNWYDQLVKQGKAVEGTPLRDETRVVSGKGGSRVIDGPFAEAKEAIGGFVRIVAANLEEATAIAQQHPGLAFGMQIEVREMTSHCHLGVVAHERRETAAN